MAKSRAIVVELAMIWMGQRFKVCKLERGLHPKMRQRVKNSAKFNFSHQSVVVYAIGYPCEVHRLAAIASSYNIAPDITIEAVDY